MWPGSRVSERGRPWWPFSRSLFFSWLALPKAGCWIGLFRESTMDNVDVFPFRAAPPATSWVRAHLTITHSRFCLFSGSGPLLVASCKQRPPSLCVHTRPSEAPSALSPPRGAFPLSRARVCSCCVWLTLLWLRSPGSWSVDVTEVSHAQQTAVTGVRLVSVLTVAGSRTPPCVPCPPGISPHQSGLF